MAYARPSKPAFPQVVKSYGLRRTSKLDAWKTHTARISCKARIVDGPQLRTIRKALALLEGSKPRLAAALTLQIDQLNSYLEARSRYGTRCSWTPSTSWQAPAGTCRSDARPVSGFVSLVTSSSQFAAVPCPGKRGDSADFSFLVKISSKRLGPRAMLNFRAHLESEQNNDEVEVPGEMLCDVLLHAIDAA